MEYIWIDEAVLLAIHDEQLAEHGGGSGVRNRGLLQSALARSRNLAVYGEDVGVAALASAYGYGVARNHPFVDGNKRTAFVVLELFLNLNGWELTADDAACVETMLALADGSLSESELTTWVRSNIRPTSEMGG